MISYRCLGLIAAALLITEEASASLITFRIDSRMEFGCGACEGFEEDTGLIRGPRGSVSYYPVTAKFTIDTETAPSEPPPYVTRYEFAGPRTRLEVTIGKLILKYDQFELNLYDDSDCDQFFISSEFSGGLYSRTGFTSGNCDPSRRLSDYSLQAFAKADLSKFAYSGFETWVFPPNRNDGRDWWLQGSVYGITRVPEPGTVAIYILGLMGLALTRLRPRQ